MANSTVAIAHSPDIQTAINEALDKIRDLAGILTGKHVAIKPNDTWASAADLTACTQADTVRAVVRHVKRYKPRQITITGGSGAAETDQVFRLLGIDEVIRSEGVMFFDHNKGPFKHFDLDYGPQRHVMVNPAVLDYDVLISLAQHKVHDSATVTLTMKNIAMSYPAADYYGHPRDSYLSPHQIFKDLHAFIAAMCKRFPPSIGIVVGHPAMLEKGPIGGMIFDSDLVLAGTDFVACDAVGAFLLDKPDVRHIRLAQELGLGTADLDSITIAGVPLVEAQRIFRQKAETAKTAA